MADISKSQFEASPPASGSREEDHIAVPADPYTAWMLLDDASEDLVRAEAIVDLLGLEMQASRHQLYSAQIAGEFLRAASERVSEARDLIRDFDLASRSQPAADN